jgi:hypothetical protein
MNDELHSLVSTDFTTKPFGLGLGIGMRTDAFGIGTHDGPSVIRIWNQMMLFTFLHLAFPFAIMKRQDAASP